MHAGCDLEVAIGEGERSWVATGANIPHGANLVVPVENTEKIGDDVIVYEPGKESHISERRVRHKVRRDRFEDGLHRK